MTIAEVQILVAQARSEANNPAFKVRSQMVRKVQRYENDVNNLRRGPLCGWIGILSPVSRLPNPRIASID